jgi:hypothetical protein
VTFAQIVIVIVGTMLGRMFWDILQDHRSHRREKKFIKLVSVTFPDRDGITYISVDTSDRMALRNLEKQLREDFNIPQDQLNPIFRRTARKKK